MVFTLPTDITHGSESRVSNPKFHPGFDEQYNNKNPRNRGGYNHHEIWVRAKSMVRRQYNTYFSKFWRYSGFRFCLHYNNSWFRFHSRSGIKSSKSSVRNTSNRKRNRHYFYYGLLISLLSVGPVRAEDDTNNVSNPVAAATGNVTNQAVQFQNNGAPSRQHYGPNISCNGATMTFSPFYMGNHTTPFDDVMSQQSYTVAENWGGQVNFMIPLDREGLRRCRSMAARQEDKMRLDYELVRVLKCAELQQKGFMLLPKSRVYDMCSDVIPIASWKKAEQKVLKCVTPSKPWYKPWSKPTKPKCTMSTLSDQIAAREAAAKAKKTKKTTKSTKES